MKHYIAKRMNSLQLCTSRLCKNEKKKANVKVHCMILFMEKIKIRQDLSMFLEVSSSYHCMVTTGGGSK